MNKRRQAVRTVNPSLMKGNPSFGINPFSIPESKAPPILNIDTEAHFPVEKKANSDREEVCAAYDN